MERVRAGHQRQRRDRAVGAVPVRQGPCLLQPEALPVRMGDRENVRYGLSDINNGIDIALANKETLVMAGDIVMQLAKENGVNIIPVDSEHCAIHQCIKDISQVEKLIITASGGPFLNKSLEDIKNATVTLLKEKHEN